MMSSLFAIVARRAPVAVIFRRGPSKQVLLVKWHLDSDKLEYGQWLKGRIYERRCDLSPSGNLLIYFAASFKPSLYSWTAISKPPFLTALALWPKGDAWGGGGMFESETSVQLNHRPGQDVLAQGFRLKSKMRIALYGSHSGRGEDFPIYHSILLRNGWKLIEKGEARRAGRRAKAYWQFVKPITYEKVSSGGRRLQMQIRGAGQKNDTWYRIDHAVLDETGQQLFALPQTNWADWDDRDLLFAKGYKLFRLRRKNFSSYLNHGDKALKLVADLSTLKFEEKVAPHKATKW
jgi:hypothetical protein